MKKNLLLLVTIILLGVPTLSACGLFASTPSTDVSLTQAALFFEATTTKAALLASEAGTPTAPGSGEVIATTQPASPTSEPPVATASPTSLPPTVIATLTPTHVIPTVGITPIQPTATVPVPSAVTPTRLPNLSRISFDAGTTNASVTATLPANSAQRYVFWASSGQLIDLSLNSDQNAWFSLTSPTGKVVVDPSWGYTWYRDYLSSSGDWVLEVRSGSSSANISLYLSIPERLSFPTGAYGMTATGKVPAGRTHSFIAWGNKDQTLKVSVSPTSGLVLSIWGVDGTVLMSSMAGASSFEGKLPHAGDYIINVTAAASSESISFTMPIEIR